MRGNRWGWGSPALAGAVAALASLVACTPEEAYKRESFEIDSPFQLATELSAALACEGARRALLGQGYIIDLADAAAVKGRKTFRASGDDSNVLEMNVVCIDRGGVSTLFANAVQATYTVKKSAQSASVGMPLLGSISVPLAGSSESMVKVADETVNDKEFYKRFFAVVEYYLVQMRDAERRKDPQGEVRPTPGPSPTPQATPTPTPSPPSPAVADPPSVPEPTPTPGEAPPVRQVPLPAPAATPLPGAAQPAFPTADTRAYSLVQPFTNPEAVQASGLVSESCTHSDSYSARALLSMV